MDNLAAIASIVSAAIICIRLGYYGILSADSVAMIMVAVVVLAAIGNTITKLGICAVSIYLFAQYVAEGNQAQAKAIITAILALIIALIGLYIIIRQMTKNVF